MMHFEIMLSPILTVIFVTTIAWFMRKNRNLRIRRRTRQLTQAATYLELHASTMEVFLDHPDVPEELRRLIIEFSDVMDDRNAVARLTEWASKRPFEQPVDSEEAKALEDKLTTLRNQNPDMADKFAAAVITAIAGASLRWSESAELFECAFPRMVFTHKQDVAVAVTATRLKSRLPFSVRSPEMVMA